MENKGELVLLLYDGAIGFISRALEAVEAGRKDEGTRLILRTQAVISALKDALDMRYEVAQSLGELYDYFNRRLVEANNDKASLALCEVRAYLEDLRETWAEAATRVERADAQGVAGVRG